MSTVVFQGLQSCHEPHLLETRTLRLKLASPNSIFSKSTALNTSHCEEETKQRITQSGDKQSSSNPDLGGWSFLQSLPNTSQTPKQTPVKEPTYVHPMVKLSSSKLSKKSLELCTENLGSETGSDISDSSILSLSNVERESPREQTKLTQIRESRRVINNSQNFPPPLTSMRSSRSLQVKPHREGGRLILKAEKSPSRQTYLQAERSHGRLRLCFCRENDVEEVDDGEREEEDEEEEEEEEEDKVDREEREEDEGEEGEDMDENGLVAGVEIGMEKFRRPSRCKEGGRGGNDGLCNWEAFWVATS